ncbi:ATP-binding cassette domain-containing protein [Nonomuraea angiospora]|uniref:ABC transporter domain-containing protein n=1 Tax=Nonomuraea angiospora TaxID=46172 RepID=A0ABR9M9M3_9ACTN|nr:ATP-binding cassette domain-containing protein [Nonomuraea angiospora]MBE1589613.1 hypothetical protein [Nonomuraea angiospora]
MLIRLLGPVEVERSGQTWPVRPPQVALALAALAWEVGRVVPVDTLLARVWGEQVPPGARRTLYTIITRIRRDVLADEGAVVRRLGGYLLDVDESAVDVPRFRDLADQAMAVPDPMPPLGAALALPHGYRTLLSRGFPQDPDDEQDNAGSGVLLSGGQWQRLALARAFLRRDRDLMILDEPSAGLDPEAEYEVHGRLATLRSGRTSVVITHRLGGIRTADRIVVLTDGVVTEQGTHAALLAEGGTYAELFARQATLYRDDVELSR